jgi:glycosyltransferase involved in cell wall biosynthesis
VLGYLYPGKGVEDVIDAAATMAACGRVVSVVNYGAAAEGHEDLVGQLRDRARRAGVCFRVTGYLGDDELAVALAGAGVPVAPHRHISASGSVNSWIAAGRRPIVRRGGYSVEVADRLPGALVLADSLHDAITAAVDDPGSTHLDPATRVGPTWAQAAQKHADILWGLS